MSCEYRQTKVYNFVLANPGCLSNDLAEHLDDTVHNAVSVLHRMRLSGYVRREIGKPRPTGGITVRWYASGKRPSDMRGRAPGCDKGRQKARKTWAKALKVAHAKPRPKRVSTYKPIPPTPKCELAVHWGWMPLRRDFSDSSIG